MNCPKCDIEMEDVVTRFICPKCGYDSCFGNGHEVMNCPECGSENTGLEDIDCGECGYYKNIPTCYDCGHQFGNHSEKVKP